MSVQMVSEKVGGAEGTKLDEDFKDLERVSVCLFVCVCSGRFGAGKKEPKSKKECSHAPWA